MAQRTLISPGVEIRELDLSLIAPNNVGTNIFIAGYAPQGPTDETVKITSRADLDQIYGTPTNSAERYFYHGIKELLNSPANIYTSRLPYGSGSGTGFGSQYSALVYPAKAYATSLSAIRLDLTTANSTIVLGDPVQVTLSEDQYNQIQEGSLFTWSQSGCNRNQLSSFSALGQAGLIILNKAQTTINSQFEGYYVGVADNSNINPASNYDAITGAKTVSVSSTFTSNFTSVPLGTFQFALTATPSGNSGSVSQIMENLTDYDIDGREDDDLLNIGVFKLRKSLYATESYKLDYILDGAIVGSIDSYRTRPNQTGGPFVSFFLESEDEKDRNIEVLVNPYVSNKFGTTAVGVGGIPTRKVRVLTTTLSQASSTVTGITSAAHYTTLANDLGYADNLYPVGTFSSGQITTKELGSIPSKLERALEAVKNDEIYDIDVVVEAGLGTIHVISEATGLSYYDDTAYSSSLSATIGSLRTSNALGATGENVRADYSTIFNVFENFCNLPSNTGGRGDCMFIGDPIRHIMITGKNTKVLSDRTKNFQTDVYWAMRHQFELENTSYAAVYANWAQVYDEFLGEKIWVPFSSVAGAAYARNDAAEFPWSAPAGYTRGLVSGNVVNIAITPNQKQRDELYKSNLNPVLFSPSQGMAIFGQKTMSRKPSAFDRINVRRCFLALERPTKKASVFFVFEPNTEFTRTRFINTLTPIFEYAKNNQGIYDYLIVCDERNNTPQVIDNNEMRADIYIKPVRTAEFILVTFVATRTDANFQELIG
jgi:phage tail sheath protein FI